MLRRVTAGIVVGATVLAVWAPSAAGLTTPSACTEQLASMLTRTSSVALAPGARLTTWQRSGDRPTGPGRALRAAVVRVGSEGPILLPRLLDLPGRAEPAAAFDRRTTVAAVNGDLFDAFAQDASVPSAPVVVGGAVRYSPPGTADVVHWSAGAPRTARTRLSARVTIDTAGGRVVIPLTAVNHYSLAGGAVLFTDAWTGRVPRGEQSITLARGVVAGVDRPGTTRAPGPGRSVIQLPTGLPARQVRIGQSAVVDAGLSGLDGARFAMGHGGRILGDGAVTVRCSALNQTARPRTALAWDRAGVRWLVVVTSGHADPADGMRVGGVGVTALARWLADLGATDAVLLDGGGSTIMLTRAARAAADSGPIRQDMPQAAWQRPVPVLLTLDDRRGPAAAG